MTRLYYFCKKNKKNILFWNKIWKITEIDKIRHVSHNWRWQHRNLTAETARPPHCTKCQKFQNELRSARHLHFGEDPLRAMDTGTVVFVVGETLPDRQLGRKAQLFEAMADRRHRRPQHGRRDRSLADCVSWCRLDGFAICRECPRNALRGRHFWRRRYALVSRHRFYYTGHQYSSHVEESTFFRVSVNLWTSSRFSIVFLWVNWIEYMNKVITNKICILKTFFVQCWYFVNFFGNQKIYFQTLI